MPDASPGKSRGPAQACFKVLSTAMDVLCCFLSQTALPERAWAGVFDGATSGRLGR